MPNLTRSRTRAATLIAALALVVAACGATPAGGDVTTTTAPAETTSTTPTTVAETTSTTAAAGEEKTTVNDGDTVSVDYTGTLDDGEQFDTSIGGEPLTFTMGAGQMIPGFEAAVLGMDLGETKTVRIDAADAYGEYDPTLVIDFPADEAPEGLVAGEQVQFANGAVGTVLEVTDETVKIDGNHPLAGQALNFEITVVSIT